MGVGLGVTYPAALSQLAGPLFDIRNFGLSGATVQKSYFRSGWWRGFALSNEHQRALAFEPDLVIVNLGINDLTPGALDIKAFELEYASLVEAYQKLPSGP